VSSRSRKSVDPNNKQQKWPSPVGLNTMRISTEKIEPLVEKLKKQSDTTFGLVNNPEGLTTTVDEGGGPLLPGNSKTIRVTHS
jgi:hypothetical protein